MAATPIVQEIKIVLTGHEVLSSVAKDMAASGRAAKTLNTQLEKIPKKSQRVNRSFKAMTLNARVLSGVLETLGATAAQANAVMHSMGISATKSAKSNEATVKSARNLAHGAGAANRPLLAMDKVLNKLAKSNTITASAATQAASAIVGEGAAAAQSTAANVAAVTTTDALAAASTRLTVAQRLLAAAQMKTAMATAWMVRNMKYAMSLIFRSAFMLSIIAVVVALGKLATSAVSVQNEMVMVGKTTSLTGKDLDALSDKLLNVTRRLGTAIKDVARIATTAGQLGIRGAANIVSFTSTIAKMIRVTRLGADDAAAMMARVGNAFRIPIKHAENLGSVINELSNTTTATARDILDALVRVANVGRLAGFTVDQVAAMAATMINTGIVARRAGTGIRNILILIRKNADDVSEAMGITRQRFFEMMAQDPLNALKEYMKVLREMPAVLQGIHIDKVVGKHNFAQLSALANEWEDFEKNLATSGHQIEHATSLTEQFDRSMQSVGAQASKFWNAMLAGAAQGNNAFRNFLFGMFDGLNKWLATVQEVSEETAKLIKIQEGLNAQMEKANKLFRLTQRKPRNELVAESDHPLAYANHVKIANEELDKQSELTDDLIQKYGEYADVMDETGRKIGFTVEAARNLRDVLQAQIMVSEQLVKSNMSRMFDELKENYRDLEKVEKDRADTLRKMGTAKKTGGVLGDYNEKVLSGYADDMLNLEYEKDRIKEQAGEIEIAMFDLFNSLSDETGVFTEDMIDKFRNLSTKTDGEWAKMKASLMSYSAELKRQQQEAEQFAQWREQSPLVAMMEDAALWAAEALPEDDVNGLNEALNTAGRYLDQLSSGEERLTYLFQGNNKEIAATVRLLREKMGVAIDSRKQLMDDIQKEIDMRRKAGEKLLDNIERQKTEWEWRKEAGDNKELLSALKEEWGLKKNIADLKEFSDVLSTEEEAAALEFLNTILAENNERLQDARDLVILSSEDKKFKDWVATRVDEIEYMTAALSDLEVRMGQPLHISIFKEFGLTDEMTKLKALEQQLENLREKRSLALSVADQAQYNMLISETVRQIEDYKGIVSGVVEERLKEEIIVLSIKEILGTITSAEQERLNYLRQLDDLLKTEILRLQDMAETLKSLAKIMNSLGRLADTMGLSDAIAESVNHMERLVAAVSEFKAAQASITAARASGESFSQLTSLSMQVAPIVGAIVSGVGIIKSLFMSNNRDRQQQERERRNQAEDRLRKLEEIRSQEKRIERGIEAVEKAVRVADDVAGTDFDKVRGYMGLAQEAAELRFLEGLPERDLEYSDRRRRDDLRERSGEIQEGEKDLLDWLKDNIPAWSGLTALPSFDEITAMLTDMEANLGGFGSSVKGAVASIEFLADYVGTEAVDQFTTFVNRLRTLEGVPEDIMSSLSDIDLTTPQGQAMLDALLQSWATTIAAGGGAGLFGSLTGEEFEAMMEFLQGLVGEVPSADGSNARATVSRVITDVQANAVIRYLEIIAYWTRETAKMLGSEHAKYGLPSGGPTPPGPPDPSDVGDKALNPVINPTLPDNYIGIVPTEDYVGIGNNTGEKTLRIDEFNVNLPGTHNLADPEVIDLILEALEHGTRRHLSSPFISR